MSRIHAYVIATSMAFVLGAPAALAQSAQPPQGPITNVPNIVIPKDLIPDLIVSSAKVTATCTAKKTVTADIIATVKNISPKGIADLKNVAWQIVLGATWWSTSGPNQLENPVAKTVKPLVGGPMVLGPNATWTGKLTIVGMPRFKTSIAKQGQYGFEVTADPNNAIGEADEANNKLLIYAFDPCFGK